MYWQFIGQGHDNKSVDSKKIVYTQATDLLSRLRIYWQGYGSIDKATDLLARLRIYWQGYGPRMNGRIFIRSLSSRLNCLENWGRSGGGRPLAWCDVFAELGVKRSECRGDTIFLQMVGPFHHTHIRYQCIDRYRDFYDMSLLYTWFVELRRAD